jgi:hypothetical protein
MNAMHPRSTTSPLVVVVESTPGVSAAVSELCDFLRIRVRRIEAPAILEHVLLTDRPICVLAHAPRSGTLACDALAVVARVDRNMPVLLVTDDTRGEPLGLEEQEELHPLANLFWLPRTPGLRMLVEFLFMAERRRDVPGLLPV